MRRGHETLTLRSPTESSHSIWARAAQASLLRSTVHGGAKGWRGVPRQWRTLACAHQPSRRTSLNTSGTTHSHNKVRGGGSGAALRARQHAAPQCSLATHGRPCRCCALPLPHVPLVRARRSLALSLSELSRRCASTDAQQQATTNNNNSNTAGPHTRDLDIYCDPRHPHKTRWPMISLVDITADTPCGRAAGRVGGSSSLPPSPRELWRPG